MGARLATRMKNLVFTSVLGKEVRGRTFPGHPWCGTVPEQASAESTTWPSLPLHMQMGWFDDPRHSSAKLTSTLDSLAHLRGAVADVLGLYLETLCNLAFAVAVAFAFDWQTALLVLGVLPLLVAGTLLFYKAATASACVARVAQPRFVLPRRWAQQPLFGEVEVVAPAPRLLLLQAPATWTPMPRSTPLTPSRPCSWCRPLSPRTT